MELCNMSSNEYGNQWYNPFEAKCQTHCWVCDSIWLARMRMMITPLQNGGWTSYLTSEITWEILLYRKQQMNNSFVDTNNSIFDTILKHTPDNNTTLNHPHLSPPIATPRYISQPLFTFHLKTCNLKHIQHIHYNMDKKFRKTQYTNISTSYQL